MEMENKSDMNVASNSGKEKQSIKNQTGEMLEKVGHKISDAGAPKVGQKIHDLGDKLEVEHDNPSHPHKV